MKNAFFQKTPRMSADVRCVCYASPKLFVPWEQLSTAAKNEFVRNGPIPCEGGGVPGSWCGECRFGLVHAPEIIEE